MSAPDRSWTIAPTLLWFTVFAVGGLGLFDGDMSALADRLTQPRDSDAPSGGGSGPTFQASAGKASRDDELTPPLPAPAPGSHDVGALDDVCIDGIDATCKQWAMDGFYKSLQAAKAGTLGRALRVSWYGDSVVANDALPGRLRARLQSELGDGGPGFVYALPPHRFCAHESITRSGGDNWLTHAISTIHTADGFYGPGGASSETNSGKLSIKLTGGKVTSAELYYLQQPGGGTVTLTADGTEIAKTSMAATAKQPGWITGTAAQGASKFELRGEGKTRVFGLQLENASGAVVDNFGIVSVHAKTFATHDTAHYIAQLQHRSADLIIIMIGANEAQWLQVGNRAMKDYQAAYEKVLQPIRQARPDASCLVMSPTDEAEPKEDGGYQSRPIIGAIVDAQRKAAHAQGCAFYSSYHWMGGAGSAMKWYKKRLISSDMIHLTSGGATKMANALADALMTGSKNAGD